MESASLKPGIHKFLWYIHTMEYYSAIKSSDYGHAATWMNLITILSERSQRDQKKKLYAVWFPLHNILEKCKLTYTHGKSVQLSSVTQLCPTLCDPMNRSKPGLPVHHQLPEFTQTHVHCVGDAIQPSHPLSSHFPPAFNLSQHQGIFKWISSSHQVAKVLEFQLEHQSFQWTPRTDLL